ncbi:hypothetical protein JCM10207_002766 [Rhodosporidiobolus poonsookiae]
MPPVPISAVLFDMDGLMIDSEGPLTHCRNAVLAPYGKQMTPELFVDLMGRPPQTADQRLVDALDLPLTGTEFRAKLDPLLREAFRTVTPLPGVVRLVHHLRKHNVPMSVATSSRRSMFDVKAAHLPHIYNIFQGNVVCGDDPALQGRGKPDPAIFIEAAKRLGFSTPEERSRVLVFEDSVAGIQAARAAGMEAVWVPDEYLLAVLGERHGVDCSQQLSSLEEFNPAAWGLPVYDA